MIEKQILKLSLKNEIYNKIAHLLNKSNFPKEVATIIDVVNDCHKKYSRDISVEEVLLVHREKFPALTETTRNKIERDIQSLETIKVGEDIAIDIIHSFWKRTKAKAIGEEALEIYLGNKKLHSQKKHARYFSSYRHFRIPVNVIQNSGVFL